jgi:hypothetical protein
MEITDNDLRAWNGQSLPAKPSEIGLFQASIQKYVFSARVVAFRKLNRREPKWFEFRSIFHWAYLDAHASFEYNLRRRALFSHSLTSYDFPPGVVVEMNGVQIHPKK